MIKRRTTFGAALLACTLSLHAMAVPGGGPLPNFSAYVSREESIVVSIATVMLARRGAATEDELSPDDALVPNPREIGTALERRPVRGLASGIIVASDGQIVTSAHAVAGARELTVRLADGREYVGRVLGSDDFSDVALVKIDAERLPEASFGNPDEVAVGDWVSAIGSPFGLDASVTAGIVSAKPDGQLGERDSGTRADGYGDLPERCGPARQRGARWPAHDFAARDLDWRRDCFRFDAAARPTRLRLSGREQLRRIRVPLPRM